MKDPIKVKDLIIDKLNLADVMVEYGVQFQFNPLLVSQVQFKCPFHGKDTKPSARLYNETKSCFCWVCRKTWNVVSFIMEKEGLIFKHTLSFIIKKYKIDVSTIPDAPELVLKSSPLDLDDKKVHFHKIRANILELHGIPFEKYRALCAAYFMVKYADVCGADVLGDLKKIEDKILWVKNPSV